MKITPEEIVDDLIIKAKKAQLLFEKLPQSKIDDALYQHPNILEAAAFGVKDSYYGETIKAAVVLKDKKNINKMEVIEHCINIIGKYKSPDDIYFLDELPKGLSGKIQRLKIKELI